MPASNARALPPATRTRTPRKNPGGARPPGERPRFVPTLVPEKNPAPAPVDDKPAKNPRRRKGKGRKRGRKSNPIGTGLAFGLIAVAAATVGYVGYREVRRRRALNQPIAQSLQGILKRGATLAGTFPAADATQIINMSEVSPPPSTYALVPDIAISPGGGAEPVKLQSISFGAGDGGVPNELAWIGRTKTGQVVSGLAPEGSSKAIEALVINLTPEFARHAYEALLAKIAAETVDWDDGASRDQAITQVLKSLVKSVDWSQGLAPYVYGDDASTVWGGVQKLGAIADQSYWNRRQLES